MIIKKDGDDIRTGLFVKNDFEPVSIGKISSYKTQESSGQELELSNTYNDSYEEIKVYGKSEQKAKWHQAEGKTTQIQETGYNLLDCEAEWLPAGSDDEKGITNIVTGKGSVSFDFADNDNYNSFLENQKAIHLKAGSYYVSGNLESGTLDSVGFSGISEPIWGNCNGVITVPEEGDYKFYIYPFCLSQTLTISNLMIVEGDTSKTYQEYGYSKPSPAYPSELTSHISAGSYQIPTENGIYEVTLTEDLRGLDDTYRDFIRFDSVSGTGYLENNTLLVRMTRSNLAPYRSTSDVTYRFSGTSAFAKYLPKTNANAAILCNRLKRYHLTSELLANDIVGVSNYTESGMAYNNVYIFLSKSDIGITADDTADTMQEKAYTYLDENPLYILVGGYSYREELTFTKVESSTLPVLPWTAYGINLFDGVFESGFYTSEGDAVATNYIRSANYIPVQPNTQYHFLNNKEDDTFLWYDGGKNFISEVSDLSSPSPANARYLRFYFYGTDKTTEYIICSGAMPTVYEPFNSTPPESLIPSPDYPQQIYDLKDVTVTSRGRNLATAQQVYSGANAYLETTLDGRECVRFQDNISMKYEKLSFKENVQYTVSFEAKCVQQASASGESLIFRFFYTDGTSSNITASSNTDWKGYVLTSTAGKTVSYIGLSSYNYVNYNYIDVNTFQLEEGTERMPFDKYRCTSATIPLTLRSCGDDKDFVVSGTDIKQAKAVGNKQFVGTENIAWMTGIRDDGSIIFSVIVSDINPAAELLCNHFLQGEDASGNINRIFTIGSYQAVYFCMYANELGLTASDDESTKKTKIKAWFAKQNEIGFPVTVQYVLNTPIETEITDTWAQNMLALKTAPYYTKLYADKETGGLSVIYKCFEDYKDLFPSPAVLIQKSLIGSDGKNIVTSDGNSVIAQ